MGLKSLENSLFGPTLGPFFFGGGGSRPGLGEYDTPLELYSQWLQEYGRKPGIARVPDALEPKYCQKWPVFGLAVCQNIGIDILPAS